MQLLKPELLLNPSDKFGYYSVGEKKFHNKVMAYMENKISSKPVIFHYNDIVYDCYDWTREPEPEVGILEFYHRRAQQIRDKYDYVVLLASGGPDSTNMFEAFVHNNILVDQVVNWNSYSKTQEYQGTIHNADYLLNFKPHIEDLIKLKNLKTKITILDEVELTQQYLKDYQGVDYELLHGLLINIAGFLYNGGWIKYVPDIWDRVVRGDKVGIIVGSDKPMLVVENGKYAPKFADVGLGIDYGGRFATDESYKGISYDLVESFYNSASDVTIKIKQAHLLKKYMTSHTDVKYYISEQERKSKTKARISYSCESKLHPTHNLRYADYHKTIYPNWQPRVITEKPSHDVLRPEDNFWSRGLDPADLQIWLKIAMKYRNDFSWVDNVQHSGILPFMRTAPRFIE